MLCQGALQFLHLVTKTGSCPCFSTLGDFWAGHTHPAFWQEPMTAFPSPLLQPGIIIDPYSVHCAPGTQISKLLDTVCKRTAL